MLGVECWVLGVGYWVMEVATVPSSVVKVSSEEGSEHRISSSAMARTEQW